MLLIDIDKHRFSFHNSRLITQAEILTDINRLLADLIKVSLIKAGWNVEEY